MNKQDLSEIGTLIDQKLDEKLGPIHQKLDAHTVKLEEHSVKLDAHTVKLDAHTVKLDEHDGKFKSIHQQLDEVNQKLDSLTLDMIHVQKKTDVLKDIQSYMEGTREKVDNHEQRIQTLENAA